MDYNQILELDDITIEECLDLFEEHNKRFVINDGMLINIICED